MNNSYYSTSGLVITLLILVYTKRSWRSSKHPHQANITKKRKDHTHIIWKIILFKSLFSSSEWYSIRKDPVHTKAQCFAEPMPCFDRLPSVSFTHSASRVQNAAEESCLEPPEEHQVALPKSKITKWLAFPLLFFIFPPYLISSPGYSGQCQKYYAQRQMLWYSMRIDIKTSKTASKSCLWRRSCS